MLVSGYARYGTYDVSKVSTYNDSYNDTVSDMTGTAGTLQADKELEAMNHSRAVYLLIRHLSIQNQLILYLISGRIAGLILKVQQRTMRILI